MRDWRIYADFAQRLNRFHEAGSFFVTRGKSNLKVQRRYSHPVDRDTGLICDQTVVLTGFYSHKGFETPLSPSACMARAKGTTTCTLW